MIDPGHNMLTKVCWCAIYYIPPPFPKKCYFSTTVLKFLGICLAGTT